MAITLYDYQIDAINRMKNGCILCGGVGSGKSITAISYYYLQQDGDTSSLCGEDYIPMGDPPKDLYIITTARKRDTKEWEGELSPFLLSTNPEINLYTNKVIVDSWNNICKYVSVENAFFIFDEQRVVGSGAWVKAFRKITKVNNWILLSATPGDTWQDYIPVFLANGFYRTKKEFEDEHVVYARFCKFPKIDKYVNTKRLIRLRDSILVNMEFKRQTVSHHENIFVSYSIEKYKDLMRNRWNIWEDKPIDNASELCYSLRRVVNEDESRQTAVLEIMEKHPKTIIFYNFNYELDILLGLAYMDSTEIAEWNGRKHQPIPESDKWVYLVQYNAGAEGWNCIKTDTIIFYSQNYSYKVVTQSAGRIDRLNTPYTDLYYYHLKSRSGIDLAISRALASKKKFNETKWINSRN
ncbi:MAG: DEAD/DEAH box helicase family protein [Lachnospiraceae bacterium]|nr:DEAD/DEAH box helicase family protein [Lachnospiraceae bacterium]